jgi:hypothetical protein
MHRRARLDDFLFNPITDIERRDLLEVIEDRCRVTQPVQRLAPP